MPLWSGQYRTVSTLAGWPNSITGQNAMPWLYLHSLKDTPAITSKCVYEWHCSLVCVSAELKRSLATLCCRKSRGEVSVNLRGNTSTSTGGLKLGAHGGHLWWSWCSSAPRSKTVVGVVRGGAVTLASEPAPQAGAPEPAVGFKMHLAWCQLTSEIFGWGACCGCCTRVTAALRCAALSIMVAKSYPIGVMVSVTITPGAIASNARNPR